MNTERVAHSIKELKELAERMRRSNPQTISAAVAVRWSVALDSITKELEGAAGITTRAVKPIRAGEAGPVKGFSVETEHW